MQITPIVDHQGYFITDDGRVFCNLGKGNRNKANTRELYEIKPRLTHHGYARVYARNDKTGSRHDLYIHRLVAEHFIPNPLHKRYVNHKNCRRDDNRVENLEWVTAKENTDYAIDVGHVKRDSVGRYMGSGFKYII